MFVSEFVFALFFVFVFVLVSEFVLALVFVFVFVLVLVQT